jgi:hypothetical protein
MASSLGGTGGRLLALEAGGDLASIDNVVAVAVRIHAKLLHHVGPVIGETGFQALFDRTVKLTRPRFPEMPHPSDGAVLDPLCGWMRQQPPDVTAGAVTDLFDTFTGLLSTFIGEGLTWKLLCNAWPELSPTENP